MADVNVTFGADTSQLDAAVAKVKTETQSLTPGAPGSGVLTPVPFGLGGPATSLLERATVAAKANAAAAAQAGTAMKNYGLELEEAGGKAERAGINFGAMAERLAARLVIFEAIRLAIQAVKYAIDQISNLQQAQLQFNATTEAVDHLGARFEHLKQIAAAAFLDPAKVVEAKNALQDFGVSEDAATLATEDLAKWSKILNVEEVQLAEALGRTVQGIGSLKDWQLVTRMMGDNAAAGRQLIQTYENLQKAQKQLEAENKALTQSQDAILRSVEQMSERMERGRSRGEEFLKQTGRLSGLQEQLPKLLKLEQYGPGIHVDWLAATGLAQIPGLGGLPGGVSEKMRNQLSDYLDQYRKGLAAIAEQEGLSVQQLSQIAPKLPTDYVMRAAKEADQDQLRNLREQAEGDRAHREFAQTEAAARVQAAKTAIATGLPQAVGAPPAARWEGYTNSIKGSMDGVKTAIDTGIEKLVNKIGEQMQALDKIRSADETTAAMLSGGT